METAVRIGATPKGVLAYNASMVGMLQSCLSHLDSSLGTIPDLMKMIAEGACWREFKFPDADVVRWNAADFREFIEARRPAGCETPIGVLERALRGTDAWPIFVRLMRGEPGGLNNPEGKNQWNEVNRDNVTVDQPDPDTIPFAPEPAPAPSPRDYRREAPTGNSVSYKLRQLERGRGEKPARPDLLARVRAGELSAHAACVLAGYIEKAITVPADPRAAARRLALHFDTVQLADLMDAINEILKARA